MWAIPTGTISALKKNQVKSPSPESRVPEIGSDPPIGLDRDSGHDKKHAKYWPKKVHQKALNLELKI